MILLRTQLTETHDRLRKRLTGLSEVEYWWEPVPGCWTLRRQQDGTLLEDNPDEHPTPPPFTTIAWRLFHIASCKVMYHEYAFGPAELTWHTIGRPESIEGMSALLEQGQELLLADLDGMVDDSALDVPAPRPPGPAAATGHGTRSTNESSVGATLLADRRRPDGGGWLIIADPEGNEFCINTSPAEPAG